MKNKLGWVILLSLFCLGSFRAYTISSTGTAERIERVYVGTSCVSTPCTVTSKSGTTWVSSVSRSATGTYSVNVAANTFSATPSCVVARDDNNSAWCSINGSSTSAIGVYCATGAGAAIDSRFHMICMGVK